LSFAPLGRDFFARSVHDVAPALVGCTLLVDGVGGRVVEVEAYDREDPASHGFRGRTERNRSMFGPPGLAYVYRSYGIHWWLNLVCEDEGGASAVRRRAVEPTHGLGRIPRRRGAGGLDVGDPVLADVRGRLGVYPLRFRAAREALEDEGRVLVTGKGRDMRRGRGTPRRRRP